MRETVQQLEELAARAAERARLLEAENAELRARMKHIQKEREQGGSAEALAQKKLAEYKAAVRKRLRAVCARIKKVSEQQPALFEYIDGEQTA